MSDANVSLEDVLTGLRSENLVPVEAGDRAASLIDSMHAVQPWFIRVMVGFGAWLASLLLIGFVVGLSLAMEGGYIVIGLGMIVAAVILRQRSSADFIVQCALAASLAGQGLFLYGITEYKLSGNYDALLSIIVIMNSILFVIFPDRIHRVLSVMFATSALTILLYVHELNSIVPVLGPVFAALLIILYKQQPKFAASGRGALVRPLMTGMMLSAFGFLLLSTVYLLPELDVDYAFYPRPWVSTILLGASFLYLGSDVWSQFLEGKQKTVIPVMYGLMIVVIAAAWAAPGLLLALIVVMLGASSGNRVFIGAGITFLVIFLSTYFYGIQITMLTKSITLAATGAAVLLARWLILKVVAQADGVPANVH